MHRPKRHVPGHYLRANHTSWTPPAVISFDTETTSKMDGDSEVMTLRLWCARFTDRRVPKRVTPLNLSDSGTFAEDLAYTIHHWTRKRRTVWVYAHNLGFDMTTSGVIPSLIELGWEVTDFAVNSGSPFVRMRQGDHNLTFADSWSWFNCRLETVADAVGIPKPPLPSDDDTDGTWLARCEADTLILHMAMIDLMDWWEAEDLGNWNITGGASGWNAMRHIPSPEQILIRPDEDECNHDRRAIYGGRRSMWRSGYFPEADYTELDIEKAYTTACRDLPLPAGRHSWFTSLPLDHPWLDCERWGVIAECVISTNTPCVPVRHNNGVWYPVGRFKTTLAGPDIKEAIARGVVESIGQGWLHKLGYALRPWADWCIRSLADTTGRTPDVAKLVHKHWARVVVGKWAQRGFEVIHLGPAPNGGWDYEEAWHHGDNVPAGIVDFAGERYQVAAVSQGDNAYPAVLAFVESYVRVALNRASGIVGDERMVQCDTDGFICRSPSADIVRDINGHISPFTVRPKHHYTRVRVIGPQHMELDQVRRRAGIPAGATAYPDGKLRAHLWPKLSWQLANGRQGAYVRPRQTYTLAATYAPGWVLSDGTVVPVEMTIDGTGATLMVPFALSRYAKAGHGLGGHQNRNLEAYCDD